jgi:hypothetical protein
MSGAVEQQIAPGQISRVYGCICTTSYNLLDIAAKLGQDVLHDAAKLGRMVDHGDACALQRLVLRLSSAFCYASPCSSVAHDASGDGLESSNARSNWPMHSQYP